MHLVFLLQVVQEEQLGRRLGGHQTQWFISGKDLLVLAEVAKTLKLGLLPFDCARVAAA